MRTLSHHCEYFSILSPPYSKAAPSDPKPDFDDAFEDDSAAAAAAAAAREISRKAAGGKGSQADREGGLTRQAKEEEEEEDGTKMGKDNLVGGNKDIAWLEKNIPGFFKPWAREQTN